MSILKEPNERALDRTIVALDDLTDEEIHQFLSQASPSLRRVKIGMEVFYRYGRSFLVQLADGYGVKIFLDLKLHDIPNTVEKAIGALQGLPLEFLTIHLSGGQSMVEAAVRKFRETFPGPGQKLLGVTHLTSLSEGDFRDMWGFGSQETRECFNRLWQMGSRAGVDGLILSAMELPLVEGNPLAKGLLKICPGIRFPHESLGDQKRVAHPQEAFAQGADFLVIGRSLTKSAEWKERIHFLDQLRF